MRALLVLLLAAAAWAPLHAAELEAFSLEYRYIPFTSIKDPASYGLNSRTKARPGELRVSGVYPWRFMDGRLTLETGAAYEYLPFTYREWDFINQPSRVESLQGVKALLALRAPLKKDGWSLRAFANPGVASDFYEFNNRGLRLEAGAMIEREVDEDRAGGFGFAFSHILGEGRLLPAFRLRKRWDAFRLDFDLPSRAEAFYGLHKTLEAGAAFRLRGNNYRIERGVETKGHNVRYSVATLGPALRWRPVKRLVWTLDLGAVIGHRFETYSGSALVSSHSLKNSFFLSTGVKLPL